MFNKLQIGKILVLLLFTAKILSMPIAYIDFKLNERFVAEQLCENKDKPELSCLGKCQMKKQLEKTKDTPQSGEEKSESKSIGGFDIYQELTKWNREAPLNKTNIHLFSLNEAKFSSEFLSSVFHPPLFS